MIKIVFIAPVANYTFLRDLTAKSIAPVVIPVYEKSKLILFLVYLMN